MFSRMQTQSVATLSAGIALVIGLSTATSGQATKAAAKAVKPLDLNTATAKEMEDSLPGVGVATAKKIIAGRPYASVDDLAKAGVPARTIEEIRKLVTVAPRSARRTAATAAPTGPVNLNTATAAELETLPGIGPAHAKGIIDARPYASVDDLERVKGLGKTRIDAIRSHVSVANAAPAPATAAAPKTTKPAAKTARKAAGTAATKPTLTRPVNINTASKEELDALPGIGTVKSQAIIDARPFKTIEDIMKVKGIKEGEFGKIKDMITVK